MQTILEDFIFTQPYQDLKESLHQFYDGKTDINTVYNKFLYARVVNDNLTGIYRNISENFANTNLNNAFDKNQFKEYKTIQAFIDTAYNLLFTTMIGPQASLSDFKKQHDIKETLKTMYQILQNRMQKVIGEMQLAHDTPKELSRLYYEMLNQMKIPVVGVVEPKYYEALKTVPNTYLYTFWDKQQKLIRDLYHEFTNDNHAQYMQSLLDDNNDELIQIINKYYQNHDNNTVVEFGINEEQYNSYKLVTRQKYFLIDQANDILKEIKAELTKFK